MPTTPSLRELRERDERMHEHMILKFGHLSMGRLPARDREIVEARRQSLQGNIERIWAEQEGENVRLRALVVTFADKPRLEITERYVTGRRPGARDRAG